jgi:hypothetical protein
VDDKVWSYRWPVGKDGGWIALVSAISQLLAAGVGNVYLSSDSRLLRKIERDAALLAKLPADAKGVMETLLFYEVNRHALRRMQRASRTIDKSALATIIFIAALTALIDWGLATLAINYGWGWWIPFAAITLFGLLLSLAGYWQLYKDPAEDTEPTDNESPPTQRS